MSMNVYALLKGAGYSRRDDFEQILNSAIRLFKERGGTEQEILADVAATFGAPPHAGSLLAQPIDFPIFGLPVDKDGQGDIEAAAVEQMRTAMRLPVAKAGALMPDAHRGYAMPIGGVAVLHEAVSPSFVGYDIACRVTLSVLDIHPAEFLTHREKIAEDMRSVSSFGLDSGFRDGHRREHVVMEDPLWRELSPVRNLKDKAWRQLGSSGGGNHFFDALVGTVTRETPGLSLKEGQEFVAIMTHSGSRGAGHKLATHFVKLAARETAQIATGIPPGYEWLSTNDDAGREYLAVMELMGRYAQANHHLIHDHFSMRSGINVTFRCENHHNFAWVEEDGLVIHRKGATPAELGQIGLIPGTSGTASYIVEGLGSPRSLNSSSHGAGRPFSRTEARRRHDAIRFQQHMERHDVLHFGLAEDETMMAYKDIERAMSLQKDLVHPIARMMPAVVIMGGESDDGD